MRQDGFVAGLLTQMLLLTEERASKQQSILTKRLANQQASTYERARERERGREVPYKQLKEEKQYGIARSHKTSEPKQGQ